MRAGRHLVLVIWLASAVCAQTESHFLQRYLDHQHAIAACPDVQCYRALLKRNGSTGTVAKLDAMPDTALASLFAVEQDWATHEFDAVGAREWMVDHETVDGDHATLVLRRRVHAEGEQSQRRVTMYFTREAGDWKLGQ